MCLIIDACVAHAAFARPATATYQPVWRWLLAGKGRLVCGGRLLDEVKSNEKARQLLLELRRINRLVEPAGARVAAEEAILPPTRRSDDPHVLALARVTGARLLATDDRALMADFKDTRLVPSPRGRVYRGSARRFTTARHAALLAGPKFGHEPGCAGPPP